MSRNWLFFNISARDLRRLAGVAELGSHGDEVGVVAVERHPLHEHVVEVFVGAFRFEDEVQRERGEVDVRRLPQPEGDARHELVLAFLDARVEPARRDVRDLDGLFQVHGLGAARRRHGGHETECDERRARKHVRIVDQNSRTSTFCRASSFVSRPARKSARSLPLTRRIVVVRFRISFGRQSGLAVAGGNRQPLLRPQLEVLAAVEHRVDEGQSDRGAVLLALRGDVGQRFRGRGSVQPSAPGARR